MLTKFEIKNYKNFKDSLFIDFEKVGGYQFNSDCINNNTISKMIIYGRNATGKTNLGRAIIDVAISPYFYGRLEDRDLLNADSEEDSCRFSYTFKFDNDTFVYIYDKLSSNHYKSETLKLNNITIFDFNYITDTFNYDNLSYISAETINVDRFIQSNNNSSVSNEDESDSPLTFLHWLFANAAISAESPMGALRRFIDHMGLYTVGTLMRVNPRRKADKFFETLEGENLQMLEDFLNGMGVDCKLVSKKLPDGQNELYFKHKKLIPFFENISSGTLVLFNLYRRMVMSVQTMSFLYFDEFDAFFNYEMSERLVRFFKEKFPNCQIVFTTHNTNLMTNSLMRPDCLFILSQRGMLTPINCATTRELREGHNLEKMYISGEFEKYE